MEDKSRIGIFGALGIGILIFAINILGTDNQELLTMWPLYVFLLVLVTIGLVLNYGGKKKNNTKVGEKDPTKNVFSKPTELKSKPIKKTKETRKNRYDSNDKEWHRCHNCNTLIMGDKKLCPECGAVQKSTVKCPYCGHENLRGVLTCEKCNNILF